MVNSLGYQPSPPPLLYYLPMAHPSLLPLFLLPPPLLSTSPPLPPHLPLPFSWSLPISSSPPSPYHTHISHTQLFSPPLPRQYSDLLQHMVAISQTPKGNNGRVMDNICAAICRMIVARPDALPMDQVCKCRDFSMGCISIANHMPT